MQMDIRIVSVIEMLVSEFDAYEAFFRAVPRGAFIADGSDYDKAYQRKERALQKIDAVAEALNVPSSIIWQTVLMARRWHSRTNWEKCLTEYHAERLLVLARANYFAA